MKLTSRGTPLVEKSRQRSRTEQRALNYLDSTLRLPPERRRKARDRISSGKQPLREARRIVSEIIHQAAHETLDHSDVRELEVKLIGRDMTLCPEQENWLRRLNLRIATGDISRADFDQEAEKLLLMVNSLPLRHRKDEYHIRREL